MRLTFILVFCAVMSVSARTYSQSKRVTLDVKDVSASQLFDEIKRQCDYSFFFNEDNFSQLERITLQKSDIPVSEVLDEVFEGTNITYTLVDDVIVIKTKAGEPQGTQQDQRVIISGKVTDAKTGEPLPGVHIVIKNSILGGATNSDGEFRLVLPEPKEAAVFSFIGYITQEVSIKGDRMVELAIQMEQDIREVGEVVATGYQVIDKRELTSSIATIKSEDMELIGALNVDQMLEGKATGLMIANISTTPGAATKVRVRGGSTFTGNQSPLWVIDGVIYEDPVTLTADDINSFDNINLIGNALSGINPSDIDQIDVLKDASATAIYGTRAANGVIVITTKRGHEGSASISYSGGMSVVQAPQYSDFNLMNSKERIAVSREMYERNLGFGSNYDNVDRLGYEGALMNYWDGTYNFQQFQDQVSYLETMNTDWFGELYRPAINQQHALSASGGSKTARYYFSMGYDDQQGTEKGVDLNRITARSNLDLDLRDNVLLQFKVSGSVQKATYNHTSINVFDEAYYTARTVPIYDQDGEYFDQQKPVFKNDVYGRYNILREMDNSERNITNKDFAISAQVRWDFLKHFRLTSLASYRNTTNLTEQWITEDTYYVAQLRTYDEFENMIAENVDDAGYVPFGGVYSGGMVSQDTYSISNQLNYNRVFGESHVLNVNLGQEARSVNYWGATGFTVPGYNHYQGRGFISLDQPSSSTSVSGSGLDFANYDYDAAFAWLTNRGGVSIYPSITDRTRNSLSFFGVLNYVYDNRYVLNFNMRSDGSNTFGQYERYKFKPAWSASTRWNLHNESFFGNSQLFNELALRASYGVRGTMPSASPYLLINNYGRFNSIYYPENVASLSEFPNANLRWEKSQTVNLGLNFSLLKNRISGAFDYAYSKSTDLIQSRPVSLVNGSSVQYYNSGSKDVSSYEFSVRTVNIKHKKFSWSTNANFSYDNDRVLSGFEDGAQNSLTASDYLAGTIYRKGFPTNGFFSYQFDGLTEEGLPTFKHLVEENMSREEQLEAMLVYEGSRVPLYYGGFGTQVRYGNLSLTANFTYKLGYKTRLLKLYNGNQSLPLPYQNMNSEFTNRWQQAGDENVTNIPTLTDHNMSFYRDSSADGYDQVYVTNYGYAVPEGRNAWWMYDYSDVRTVSADHIRLKSISLNYNIPKQLLNGTGIKNLNLGVQGSNLAVWAFDKKLKGQDPDQVSGIGMPNLPTYSFSLNMTF